jgi:hypothetical protein
MMFWLTCQGLLVQVLLRPFPFLPRKRGPCRAREIRRSSAGYRGPIATAGETLLSLPHFGG